MVRMEKILLGVLIFILLATMKFRASKVVAQKVVKEWDGIVAKYQAFFPLIPKSRILAHIAVESAGDPSARNDERKIGDPSDDSVGLMGIRSVALIDYNRAFGKNYSMVDLLTPYVNVEVGTGYLELRRRHWKGNLDQASMAYNGGDGNAGSSQTQEYLARVKAYEAVIIEVSSGI